MAPPAWSQIPRPVAIRALSATPLPKGPAFYRERVAEAVHHKDCLGMNKFGDLGFNLTFMAVAAHFHQIAVLDAQFRSRFLINP